MSGFVITDLVRPIVSTAIHAGHAMRPELVAECLLAEELRLREEDPHTEILVRNGSSTIVVETSRFEVDLNRPRENAVYRVPADAWGLEVWREPLGREIVERSLVGYDEFYESLRRFLDDAVARHGRVVLLDIHSYNHRREGPQGPVADVVDNPEVNLGTGWLDRDRWGEVADAFLDEMLSVGLDARENVRFRGGHLVRWLAQRYPTTVCGLAVEFKKTFMDEWSGELDGARLERARLALESCVRRIEGVLAGTA